VAPERCGEPPTGDVNQGLPKMHDQSLFLQTLSRFAESLACALRLGVALTELTESVCSVLGLSGSGVTMAEEGGCVSWPR
jgi:hypothetical protein